MAALHRLLRSSAAVAVAAARRGLCTVESEPGARFPAGLARRAAAEPPLARRGNEDRNVQWVFLGCPGVGKGTYASRLSQLLGVPHIATGDLVREELASSGPLSRQAHQNPRPQQWSAPQDIYIDPEYHNTSHPSEKTDVYSFGVVLLEVITGQSPILSGSDGVHIVQWVRQRLARGNIEGVVDSRMRGEYDINSVWKVADVALKCTAQSSSQRPLMPEVVMQLKDSLELEEDIGRSHNF